MIESLGWRYVFWYVGIAMGTLAVLSSLTLGNPPPGWKPRGWDPPDPKAEGNGGRDFTFAESVRTIQFWLLYLSYFLASFGGLVVIGHIAGHGLDSGLTAMQAGLAVSALAGCNAITRIVTGLFVDRLGTRALFLVYFGIQACALLVLHPAGSTPWQLWLTAAVIGWNYGGMFTLFPAACLALFGGKSQGANYGLLFTAFGLAGFAGPSAGGFLKDVTGSYFAPFALSAGMVAIAFFLFASSPIARRTSNYQRTPAL
jgi:OFA family oxalate/formate antiporter-like MFS transporter